MINRKKIIENAKMCAERFVDRHFEMSKKANYNALKQQMTQDEILDLDNFVNVRMPARFRKEGRVSFRQVNLNLVASKTEPFRSLHDRIALYSLSKHGRHDESTTLAFLADCMMIKGCGEARPPKMNDLSVSDKGELMAIWWDVRDIFKTITSAYGINYLEDLEDRTLEIAGKVISLKRLSIAA